MGLNTTSFLAGVGSVVAVLSTGLAGGYFLAANPSHIDPPNRLPRVAPANQDTQPAPVTTGAKLEFKPERVSNGYAGDAASAGTAGRHAARNQGLRPRPYRRHSGNRRPAPDSQAGW